jgi:hypothetical protein
MTINAVNHLANPKTTHISELMAMRGTSPGQTIIALLDILISEAREDNDTADPVTVPRNQGKIEAWKQFRDYIIRGLPNI